MSMDDSSSSRSGAIWKYALIGGLASIPFTLGMYWLSGTGNEFSSSMVFFGGLLAGYLSKRDSIGASRAGGLAGVIGGLPGLIWIFPALLSTVSNFDGLWSTLPMMALFAILFGTAFLLISALVGILGGEIGGWLFERLGNGQTPSVST